MQLKIQRFMQDTKHIVRFYLLHGEPKPGMYDFMVDRPLSELARLWRLLDGRFVDERGDANSILVSGVEGWGDVTLKQLSKHDGFVASGDPIVLAAVEEAVRRAVAVLFMMDQYAARFAKQEEDLELNSSEAAPTGLPAVPPK